MLDGICEKSPLALDKKHVYGQDGKCIYCDHLNEDKVEEMVMGDTTWRKIKDNVINDADGEYLVCKMEKVYVRDGKMYDYMTPGEPMYMEPTHYAVKVKKDKKCPGITNIDKQAAIQEMFGSISSANARVAGMMAENKQREACESSMAFTFEDFENEASNIDRYVSNIRVMRNHL